MTEKLDWCATVYHKKQFKDTPNWDSLRSATIERDHGKCRRCRGKENLTAHHIMPHSRGGADVIENLITLCIACHDVVELAGYTTKAEIASTEDDPIKKLPEKPLLDREETFERPEWHAWVYGGVGGPSYSR